MLRNGIEIGSSRIAIDGPVTSTEAFTFTGLEGEQFHWLRLRLPGQPAGALEMTMDERARGHMPEEFRRLLAASLVPGSTLLVTRESIRSGGTGKKLTLITAEAERGHGE